MKHSFLAFVVAFSFALLLSVFPFTACEAGAQCQFGDGNPVMQGGINRLGDTVCESKEETYALETQLRSSGYVLVTTDDKDISDKDFETLTEFNYRPPYFQYFDNDSFGWDMQMYKVYLYKASLDDALRQLRSEGRVCDTTKIELSTSTVLIDYADWFFKERTGRVLNEFNDNIPSWYTDTGFLEIQSPIDARVTLELWSEHTYSVLYVKAGEPLLVKMKEGMHIVREINYIGIAVKEEAIPPFNNMVVRADEHTIDNPRIMNLEGVVEKYEVPPLDISDKPDYNWENKDNLDWEDYSIPAQSVEVDSVTDVEKTPETSKANMFWLFAILAFVTGLLFFVHKKVTKGEER